jgi:nucleoside triphosphate pyrophosphatase
MKKRSRKNQMDLILASSSPRRKDLLSGIGLRFKIVPADIEEQLINGETPDVHVQRLALAKANEVSRDYPEMWVLGADTIVAIDRRILGKPDTREHAAAMLSTIAGRTHVVFTAYALVNARYPDLRRIVCVTSEVKVRDLTLEEIQAYIDTGEPMDKAGSYAIQGIGSGIVESVSGSYTNVVGLPLCEVARDLQELEIFDFLAVTGKKDR